ncbi:hypothetical protein MMC21_007794 [Puttea exsequens]|nr:hypothetical protein [Puttea exsequens]
MASDLETLLSMGFPQNRADMAVKQTGGLQGAMDWLEKNQDKTDEEITAQAESSAADATNEPANLQPGEVAKSLVCDECGKKFRGVSQAEFHGNKTGHENFSESTEEIAPLTEEEKKAKLQELLVKKEEKNARKAEEDKIANKRNEVNAPPPRVPPILHNHFLSSTNTLDQEIRRKSTKETSDMKEELKKKEQLKEATKKKQEKQDEIAAKQRIKAKIEADKEERRLRAAKEKAEREGRAPPPAPPTEAPTTSGPVASKPASAYTETRLRLQAPSGNIQKSFPVDTTLFEVAAAVSQETGTEVASFTQGFPRKTFDAVDFGASLKELGLVPSASLIVK